MPGFEVIGSEELAEVQSVFENGGILFRRGFDNLRNGSFKVDEFENEFARFLGVDRCLAVTSGTAALRVALAALGIGEGDEVIIPSFTFVATAEAVIESGATPVGAEIDLTLNLDPTLLERMISPKTKAVIVVHMLGTPARLPEIVALCKKHNVYLIEDTAWGCGGSLDGKPLGTWGDVGAFSFDFAKTMTTGEGGMLAFRDIELYARAAAWHDHGHENNPVVPRWEDTRTGSGFNFRMMELQGAVGLAQLRKLPIVVKNQQKNSELIWDAIKDIPGVTPREAPEGTLGTADALVFFAPTSQAALNCRQSLLSAGISTKILPEAITWHFAGTWNHMPELVAAHNGELANAFPQSREILSRAVSIPVSVNLTGDFTTKVFEAVQSALEK